MDVHVCRQVCVFSTNQGLMLGVTRVVWYEMQKDPMEGKKSEGKRSCSLVQQVRRSTRIHENVSRLDYFRFKEEKRCPLRRAEKVMTSSRDGPLASFYISILWRGDLPLDLCVSCLEV